MLWISCKTSFNLKFLLFKIFRFILTFTMFTILKWYLVKQFPTELDNTGLKSNNLVGKFNRSCFLTFAIREKILSEIMKSFPSRYPSPWIDLFLRCHFISFEILIHIIKYCRLLLRVFYSTYWSHFLLAQYFKVYFISFNLSSVTECQTDFNWIKQLTYSDLKKV